MKKIFIRYLAVLLSFAALITLFTACKKDENKKEKEKEKKEISAEKETEKNFENSLIYEDDDKIFYRKSESDDAYELVTDSNGVTVVDENGNLLWKVTDSNGNDRTHPVSYPVFLVEDGNYMSCQQFTIKLPKGWESLGNVNFRIKDFDKNRSIEYSYLGKEDNSYVSVDESVANIEESFKPMVEEGTAKITKSTTQVAGRDALKVVIEVTNNGADSYMESYYLENRNGTMCFNCFCNYEDRGFDFKAILDTIEYRV